MKKNILIIICIALAVIVIAYLFLHKATDQHNAPVLYTSQSYHYQLYYPNDWYVSHQVPNKDLGNAHISGMPKDTEFLTHDSFHPKDQTQGMAHYFDVSTVSNPHHLSLDDWIKQYSPPTMSNDRLQPVKPELSYLSDMSIGGQQAKTIEIVYDYITPALIQKEVAAFTLYNDQIYVIGFPPGDSTSQEILKTFRFLNTQ